MPNPAIDDKETNGAPVIDPWAHLLSLPCELTAELSLPGFKVSDLLRLNQHAVLDSKWKVGTDVPLRVNGSLIAWSEIEVVRERLAVRLTELA